MVAEIRDLIGKLSYFVAKKETWLHCSEPWLLLSGPWLLRSEHWLLRTTTWMPRPGSCLTASLSPKISWLTSKLFVLHCQSNKRHHRVFTLNFYEICFLFWNYEMYSKVYKIKFYKKKSVWCQLHQKVTNIINTDILIIIPWFKDYRNSKKIYL